MWSIAISLDLVSSYQLTILPTRMQLPVEHSAPDSHEKSRHHMILNESTEGSAILWHQILVMGRDWNEVVECVRVREFQSFLQIDSTVLIY